MPSRLIDDLTETFVDAAEQSVNLREPEGLLEDAFVAGAVPLVRALKDLAYSDAMTSADMSGEEAVRARSAEEWLEALVYRLEAEK